MPNMMDAFKDVFRGENCFAKHVNLLALSGICGILSLMAQSYSSQMKNVPPESVTTASLGHFLLIAFGFFIASFICSVFLQGFYQTFINKKWNNEEGLPEFCGAMWGRGFKSYALIIVWSIILAIIFAILGFVLAMITAAAPFIGIPLLVIAGVVLIMMSAGLVFLQIALAKEYNLEGLFNLKLPFVYIKHSIKSLTITGLKFIIPCLLMFAIIFVVAGIGGFIIAFFGGTAKEFGEVVGAILGAYFGAVINLAWYSCLLEIFQNEISQYVVEDDYDIG